MRPYLAGWLAIAVSGCAGGSVSTPTTAQAPAPPAIETVRPVKLTPQDIAAIHAGARRGLKDPESARFGKIIAGIDSKGSTTVCLMVNAKNSYGGYTGEKPMMGVLTEKAPKAFVIAGQLSSDMAQYQDQVTHKVCADTGLPLI